MRRRLYLSLGTVAAAALAVNACKTASSGKAGVKEGESDVAPSDQQAPAEPTDQQATEADGDQVVTGTPFDVNDWSILFPKTADGLPYPNITLDGFTDLKGTQIWPKATAFQNLIDFAQGKDFGPGSAQAPVFTAEESPDSQNSLALADAFNFKNRTIGSFVDASGKEQTDAGAKVGFFGADVTTQANWRVLSLRADPCAEQDASVCNVEFRLIVQPFAQKRVIDTAAHLLYNMGKLTVAGKNSEISAANRTPGMPVTVTFRALVKDLSDIKALSAAAGGNTNGQPLGVHPGLAAEVKNTPAGTNGKVAAAVVALIKKFTQGGLTTVTSMQLTSPPEPWIFFVGDVKNGTWIPATITGGTKSNSIRFAAGGGDFTPVPTNSSGISNSKFMGFNPTDKDLQNAFIIDHPGKFGGADRRNSVNNTDCISCHVGATGIQRIAAMSASKQGLAINPATGKPNMYIPAEGVTSYIGGGVDGTTAVASGIWDFRNFGMNDNARTSSIESRMLNEAGEVVRFVNQDILGVANPGFVCKAGASDADRAKNHAALWDCNVKQRLTFAACVQQVCTGGGTPPPNGVPTPVGLPKPRPPTTGVPRPLGIAAPTGTGAKPAP